MKPGVEQEPRMDDGPKEPGRWIRRIPVIAIGAALLLTYHSLVVWPDAARRSGFSTPLPQSQAAVALTILFLVLAAANIATVPILALRGELRSVGARIDIMAYGFAFTPAVYGVVVAMLTGRRLLDLPFAAIAVLAIGIAYVCLRAFRGSHGSPDPAA